MLVFKSVATSTQYGHYEPVFAAQIKQIIDCVKRSVKSTQKLDAGSSFLPNLTKQKNLNINLILTAYHFVRDRHVHQKRASGEPYLVHLLGTAQILAEYGADAETVAAGLLHDVVEDTDTSVEEIRHLFGANIASIVDGVTKLDELSLKSRKTKQIKYLQHILVASTKDIRVLIIKLADKLHNIRTLDFLPQEKRMDIAVQVLDVYGPLAHRVGLHNIESEMEDSCFPIVYPRQFEEVKSKLEQCRGEKDEEIREMIKRLESKAKALRKGYAFDVKVRGYYSIYRKMQRMHKFMDEIYDFEVLLVLTDSLAECYEALGLVHTTFHPVPQKLKDYIAIPQLAYNAIHTTVIGSSGQPVKVYIQTKRMYELASKGLIAWLQRSNALQEYSEEEWDSLYAPNAESHSGESSFYDALKKDFLEPQIFVFTVNGGIVKLSWGSSAVDFAYKLNPEIGNRIDKVKINGKIVPLWTVLDSGDLVEIITAQSITVNKEWMDFAKSHNTKEKIRKALDLRPSSPDSMQNVLVVIRAVDRTGLLADLSHVIAEHKIFIDEHYLIKEEGTNVIKDCFLIRVKGKKEVDALVDRCSRVHSVLEVSTA